MADKSSQISGFYKLPVEERVELIKKHSDLNEEETAAWYCC